MKLLRKANQHKVLLENMSYLTLLECFILIAPLITYPYLVNNLGMEIYGIVITAQALASYASKIIDFGSNRVCAKHVSINRDDKEKLSEIVNSVFVVRFVLWVLCFAIYLGVVFIIPIYREHLLLFVLTYGLTLNDVLFPQYFFQGIEKMKYSSLINIFIKLFFIVLIFAFVHSSSDYYVVPLLYTLGYALAGIISVYIVYRKIQLRFYIPRMNQIRVYVADSMPIFATDMISIIKDKLSYFLLGAFSGMSNVVVYDLGLKINTLLSKPVQIISTALFPRSAKNRNSRNVRRTLLIISSISIVLVILTNIFLPSIVRLFINQPIDLGPIRLFTLAPIFLSISSFVSSNIFVAWGYNRFVLISIIITTGAYLLSLLYMYLTHRLDGLYAFVIIALVSYLAEFIYRVIQGIKITKTENNNENN